MNTIWRTCYDEVIMLIDEGQMDYGKEPQSFDMDQSETLFWYIAGLLLSRNIMENTRPVVESNSNIKKKETCKDEQIYAVVIPLGEVAQCLLLGRKRFKILQSSGNYLLRIHCGIQKAIALHECEVSLREESCKKETSGCVTHSGEVDEGGLYFIFGTAQGFPLGKVSHCMDVTTAVINKQVKNTLNLPWRCAQYSAVSSTEILTTKMVPCPTNPNLYNFWRDAAQCPRTRH